MSLPGYDNWATGGRYHSHPIVVTCPTCEHQWHGIFCEEYGTGWLEPYEECPDCGEEELTWVDDDGSSGP